MLYVIVGITLPAVALLTLALWRERPWPRKGHGVTYFVRTQR